LHQQRGRDAEALASLEKALAISRGEPHVLAALGRLEELIELARAREVSAVHFATVHVARGEIEKALASLERAERARSGWLVYLRTEPRFDPLREEPRFQELLSRI
jgi:hypothetical protein